MPTPRETFAEALQEFLNSQGAPHGLLMDWIVVSAEHIAEQGGTSTAVGIWGPDDQPIYRRAGLLKYATERIDLEITSN